MPHVAFDRAAGYYDATRALPDGVPERIRDAILELTGADSGTRFLELGVGTGRIGLPFITAGHYFTGVDLSRPMMAELERKLPLMTPAQRARCQLVEGDITRLPLADKSYDVAVAVHVMHLVDGWQAALREAKRVLRRPGGWLLIARDDLKEDAAEGGAGSARDQVNQQWELILRELGIDRSSLGPGIGRAGSARQEGQLDGYLQEIGGQTHQLVLIEHPEIPLSPRAMAQRHIDRMYSSDWLLPDAIHADAARRLADWVAIDCQNPDVPRSAISCFRVLAARW